MKVKVFSIENRGYYEEYSEIFRTYKDWEEISDEDYYALVEWCKHQSRAGIVYYIMRDHLFNDPDIQDMIAEGKKFHQERIRKEKQKEKKNKEAAEKRKATIEENKRKKELAKLKELQEKYGEAK